ncbi:hypothetical protein PHYSODRAFT_285069, partial [Phytophthora sojae]
MAQEVDKRRKELAAFDKVWGEQNATGKQYTGCSIALIELTWLWLFSCGWKRSCAACPSSSLNFSFFGERSASPERYIVLLLC